jgi:hypothetical protein
MKMRVAEPPANQEKRREMPSKRLGKLDGGGCGYVRGGIMGACWGCGSRLIMHELRGFTNLQARAKEHLFQSPSNPSQQEIYASNWDPRVVFEENEGKNGLGISTLLENLKVGSSGSSREVLSSLLWESLRLT